MMRFALVLVLLAGCQQLLGLQTISGDARRGGDALGDTHRPTETLPDALFESGVPELVQSASTISGSAATEFTIGSAQGLAAVTPGDMVLIMCGTVDDTGPCTPTSTPGTEWLAIDSGKNLSAFV